MVKDDPTARRALAALVVVATLVRLAWAFAIGPGNDEAYYALFLQHPDWSYYDQPPMVALVASAGGSLWGHGPAPIAWLRLGFIALSAGSTLLMARLSARFFGERAGLLAAFLLNVTPYYGLAAGTFLLPDGPLLFFWLLTLDLLAIALERPDRLRLWTLAGLAWGGALLSKYHAVLLPFGFALFLLLDRASRNVLRRPGPYLALAVGLVAFAPVIVWNAAHGWASFAFQGGRAIDGGAKFRPEGLLTMLGGQAFYLFPWIWLGLIAVLWTSLMRQRRGAAWTAERFLVGAAVPPLVFFTLIACVRPTYPHWALIGFVPLFPMLGRFWSERWESHPRRQQRRAVVLAALPIVLALVAAVQARTGVLQRGGEDTLGLIPAGWDPSVNVYGWDHVADELRRRGLTDLTDTFLFTSQWYDSGQLAFALRGSPGVAPVLCYHPHDSRSFPFWTPPDRFLGRDGILLSVGHHSTEPGMYDRWFERIEPLGSFPILRAGVPVRTVRLYRCVRQTKPFPEE